MHKFKVIFISLLFFGLLSECQTVKKKTEELSKFIGKSSSELKIKLGKPDEDFKNEKGNLELIYNSKKYLIPCERRFEINSEDVVIGFVSNGCF